MQQAPARARVTALDGLRGLALVAILAFHANPRWLPGAALSVTVFFTLSGFLITSLLVREIEGTGRIDLRRFWVRRARRLVPGSIAAVVLIAVLLEAGLRGGGSVIGDAVGAMTWTANWRFVANGSTYASLFRDPSPFQHFWSLAVEEQVYLLLPVTALLLLGRGHRNRARFAVVVAAGIAVSTWAAFAAEAAGGAGGHAYYGTDARMAEPLVGALLALLLTTDDGFVRLRGTWLRVLDVAGALALVGLGYLLVVLSVEDPRLYRGGFLAGAALAAVLVLALTQETMLARVLRFRPLAALGAISYAVYLFHWPLFQWIDRRQTATPGRLAIEVGATLVLAALSTRVLEEPIRRRRTASLPVFATAWANAAVTAVALVAAAVAIPAPQLGARQVDLGRGVDDPVPPPPVVVTAPPSSVVAQSAHGAVVAPPSTANPTTSTSRPVNPQEAAMLTGSGGGDDWASGNAHPPPGSDPTQLRVAVVGDSLAHNVAKGLAAWAQSRSDVVVYDLSISFCPLSRGGERRWEPNESFQVNPGCAWWNDPSSPRSVDFRAFAPNVVVDVAPYSELLDRLQPDWSSWREPANATYRQWLVNEYTTMFNDMQLNGAAGVRFLTLNAPCADFSRPRGWERVSHPGQRVTDLDQGFYPLLAQGAQGDLNAQLCPNGRYTDDLWGISDARPDGMHLNDAAGAELARRWLGPLVLQVGGRSQPTAPILGGTGGG